MTLRSNALLTLFYILSLLLCMGTQCKENYPYIPDKYHFQEQISVATLQKTYSLGDTIWLSYSKPTHTLYDILSRQEIPMDSISVNFQLVMNGGYNFPLDSSGGFCSYISDFGLNAGRTTYLNDNTLWLMYRCSTYNPYDFKVGIILTKKGVFTIGLGSRGILACPNRVNSVPQSTLDYFFNVEEGNKDVYLSIPVNSRGESDPGQNERLIDQKRLIAVRVI